MKNLENYGVQELNSKEKVEIDGGIFWGKVYSNARKEGGIWVHTIQVYRFGVLVRTIDREFTPGDC